MGALAVSSASLAERVARSGGEAGLGLRPAGSWPVPPALAGLLPGGLPRGGTVVVDGSVSLLLAAVGAASAQGAWCALAGLPQVGAEAVAGFGLVLARTPVVAAPPGRAGGQAWAGLIAALIDAVDIVAACPGRVLSAADLSRLTARARTRAATLLLYGEASAQWAGADVRLSTAGPLWLRTAGPRGRLVARRLSVRAQGRGRLTRPSSAEVWLPARTGGVLVRAGVASAAPDLSSVR